MSGGVLRHWTERWAAVRRPTTMAKSGEVAQAAPAEIATATVEGLDGGPTHEHPIPARPTSTGSTPSAAMAIRTFGRPALDELAAHGHGTPTACFTPTAICTPARASLVTGCSPYRHKLLANARAQRRLHRKVLAPEEGPRRPSRGGCERHGYKRSDCRASGTSETNEPAELRLRRHPISRAGTTRSLTPATRRGWPTGRSAAVSEVHDPIRADLSLPADRGTCWPAASYLPVDATFETFLADQTRSLWLRTLWGAVR